MECVPSSFIPTAAVFPTSLCISFTNLETEGTRECDWLADKLSLECVSRIQAQGLRGDGQVSAFFRLQLGTSQKSSVAAAMLQRCRVHRGTH
jgi:hypothetical protein